MCGITGYVGSKKCIPYIIGGLERLEYRGYDSAGIAYVKDNNVYTIKSKGKIENLKNLINTDEESYLGIGHTRWATHGEPSDTNSHPHRVGKVTLVHNGIVENYKELSDKLGGYKFRSETDSEVLAAYIDNELKKHDILEVLNSLKKVVKGSYALGIIIDGDDKLYAIRKDSPLIIGFYKYGYFIASDVPAILEYTNKYIILENNDYAVISKDRVTVYNNGKEIKKKLLTYDGDINSAMKNGYDHFMLKEIHEEPYVVMDTINEYINDYDRFEKVFGFIEKYKFIDIVACGSSYHVGLLGEHLINKYSDINIRTYIASEYRYSRHKYDKNHLIIIISQSGETADSLAVLREANKNNIDSLAIVNVYASSIAREAKKVIYTKAGSEIAVATTKAYSCQFMILSLIALYLGIKNGYLSKDIIEEYKNIGKYIAYEVKDETKIKDIAKQIYQEHDIFFLGRGIDYYLSMEASLKLKEVSYIHSEAYASGELKHGTISLIKDGTPIISIISDDDIRLKTISNIKEACSRGAYSIIISNKNISDDSIYKAFLHVCDTIDLIEPILIMAKCQLLAYYVALYNNCDIDKPRNLAKSVTVE